MRRWMCCLFLTWIAVPAVAQHSTTKVYGNALFLMSPPNGPLFRPKISCNGRFIVYSGLADNLATVMDGNMQEDVFVLDRTFPISTLCSVRTGGVQGNGRSFEPAVSGDGDWVAFASDASNLVVGDSNGRTDVFLHQVSTGITTLVSQGLGGAPATGDSRAPVMSDDARYIVFQSSAPNLVAMDNNSAFDVFRHDRILGTMERVSVNSMGIEGNGGSFEPDVDASGDLVVFTSRADNLIPADGNTASDVFLRDFTTGTTTRVSHDLNGLDSDGGSGKPSLSWNGRFVTFTSRATDLINSDNNMRSDVFRQNVSGPLDRIRVSVSTASAEGNGDCYCSSVSDDGDVTFGSDATNLVTPDGNLARDVFLRQVAAGKTVRVSKSYTGIQGNDESSMPDIDASGCDIVFMSEATNLAPPASPDTTDIYLHRHAEACDCVTLQFNPETPQPGTTLTLNAGGGKPFAPLGLVATHVNGAPFGGLAQILPYDNSGNLLLPASTPVNPNLFGVIVTFQGITPRTGGGFAFSNLAWLQIQP